MAVVSAAEDLFADWSMEYGPAMVIRRLWEKLGLHEIINQLVDETEMSIDVQEAIFCMDKNGIVKSWCDFAKDDLITAKYLLGLHPLKLEIICYHCQ